MANAGRILIIPKGGYNEEYEYEMLDMVRHNNTAWVAKKSVQGIEPSDENEEYWFRMGDVTEVVDNLLSESADMALSANQGRVLSESLLALSANVHKQSGGYLGVNISDMTVDTANIYDCAWQDYELLVITFGHYANVTDTITVPYSYFNNSTTSNRVILRPVLRNEAVIQIYQNGKGRVAIMPNSSAVGLTDYHIYIYGIIKRS